MPVTTADETASSSSGSAGQAASVSHAGSQSQAAATPDLQGTPRFLSDRVLALVDRYRVWAIVSILVLYIAGFNGQWRLEPDSALYLAIGRNLAEGKGYTYHGKEHRMAYPGVPVVFAGLFKVFGTNGNLLPHIIVMWLMGLATLGLTYRLFLLHSGRPTALLMTFGVAVSRVFYRYSFELLSDLPFLFGVMAFFVGYEAIFYRQPAQAPEPDQPDRPRSRARWYDYVLLIFGLGYAVAARPSMWALVAAAGLAMLWSLLRGRPSWRHVAVVAMVVAAVGIFYLKDPRHQKHDPKVADSTLTYAEEDQLFNLEWQRIATMLETARHNLPTIFEQAVAKASFGGPIAPVLNSLLALAVIVAGVLLVRTRALWGMWVLATLLMVLLVPKPLDRYFLPVLPIFVFAWWTLARWAERRVDRRWSGMMFLLLFGLGGIPNIMSTCAFIFEQRQMPFLSHYKRGRYASVYEVAQAIQQRTPASGDPRDTNTTWICAPEKFGRILTLLGRRYCVEPEIYSPLQPAVWPHIYVLEPTEQLRPEGESRRIPLRDWLKQRNAMIDPNAIGAPIPNKDPDDNRPWTLHHTIAIPQAPPATKPATQPPSSGPSPSTQGAAR